MKKVKCNFDGEIKECKVIENLGFQGGVYALVVEHENVERIVQRYRGGTIYRPRTVQERLQPKSNWSGQ